MELTRRGAARLPGAAGPAAGTAGTAGHSFVDSGSYTADDDLDFLAGQSGWFLCNRLINGWTNASNHNLVPFIGPSGLGEVQAENHSSPAQCSTSLDGVPFARSVLV